jgi:hypothetical protein
VATRCEPSVELAGAAAENQEGAHPLRRSRSESTARPEARRHILQIRADAMSIIREMWVEEPVS